MKLLWHNDIFDHGPSVFYISKPNGKIENGVILRHGLE